MEHKAPPHPLKQLKMCTARGAIPPTVHAELGEVCVWRAMAPSFVAGTLSQGCQPPSLSNTGLGGWGIVPSDREVLSAARPSALPPVPTPTNAFTRHNNCHAHAMQWGVSTPRQRTAFIDRQTGGGVPFHSPTRARAANSRSPPAPAPVPHRSRRGRRGRWRAGGTRRNRSRCPRSR